MNKRLFPISILNYCDSMKTLSTLLIVIILLFTGCLGIFEEDFDDYDGFLDTIDAFPNDSNEWLSTCLAS